MIVYTTNSNQDDGSTILLFHEVSETMCRWGTCYATGLLARQLFRVLRERRLPGVAFTLLSSISRYLTATTLSLLIAYNSTHHGYFHRRRSEPHVLNKESAAESNRTSTRSVMSIAGGVWWCRIEGKTRMCLWGCEHGGVGAALLHLVQDEFERSNRWKSSFGGFEMRTWCMVHIISIHVLTNDTTKLVP